MFRLLALPHSKSKDVALHKMIMDPLCLQWVLLMAEGEEEAGVVVVVVAAVVMVRVNDGI